jgi:hypothetical protein
VNWRDVFWFGGPVLGYCEASALMKKERQWWIVFTNPRYFEPEGTDYLQDLSANMIKILKIYLTEKGWVDVNWIIIVQSRDQWQEFCEQGKLTLRFHESMDISQTAERL